MASLFIDPSMLASPPTTCSLHDFDNYVNHLVHWQELKDCDWATVYISGRTLDLLYSLNKYPLWDDIEAIIARYEIDYVQPLDVVNLVNSFLEKFRKIEESLNIEDILFSDHTTAPALGQGPLQEVLYETLAMMSLRCIVKTEQSENQILITGLEHDRIQIDTIIRVCEFSDDTDLTDDYAISDTFACCNTFKKLTSIINTVTLWQICAEAASYLTIMKMHAVKRFSDSGQEIKLLSSKVSREFISSSAELHFNSNEKKIKALLDAASEVLTNNNLASTHFLREGQGPNDPQVEYNSYKAWRKDIDYEYHLHYWKRENEVIFAKIVPHNDFSITF